MRLSYVLECTIIESINWLKYRIIVQQFDEGHKRFNINAIYCSCCVCLREYGHLLIKLNYLIEYYYIVLGTMT